MTMLFRMLCLVLCLIPFVASLNFLAVGDWGGDDNDPYTTPGQVSSAFGMARVAKEIDSKFVIAAGDNIYHYGVQSEEDPRFLNSYENVYNAAELQTDWYVVAGNHDHRGNVSAQISYSGKSSRWNFPSEFYVKTFRENGKTTDIIFIDTVALADLPKIEESDPELIEPLHEVSYEFGGRYWAWVAEQLALSRADHLIVVGHYPVYSGCSHGNTATLLKFLRPLLQKHSAHYISGHDHCMEHIIDTDAPVHYFLTGMGVECCYPLIRKHGIPEGALQWEVSKFNNPTKATAGFTSFRINDDGMVAVFHNQDGDELYRTATIAPRKK